MIQYPEQIRRALKVSQTAFAEKLGLTAKSYQGRLNGKQADWRLSELITLCSMNEGSIAINLEGKDYLVKVLSIDEV